MYVCMYMYIYIYIYICICICICSCSCICICICIYIYRGLTYPGRLGVLESNLHVGRYSVGQRGVRLGGTSEDRATRNLNHPRLPNHLEHRKKPL